MAAKVWKNLDVAGADDLTRWERSAAAIKVDMYGAAGDGVTDDATAINNAILAAAKTSLPVVVQLIPNAVHLFKSPINLASNVHLDGNGATLKWAGTVDRPLSFSSISKVKVSDLTVDVGGKSSGSAIWAFNCDRLRFDRVKVTGTYTTGGSGFVLNGCTNSILENCEGQGTGWVFNITGASSFCKIIRGLATGTAAGVLINPSGTSAPSDIDIIDVTVKDFPVDADGNPTAVMSYPIRSAGTSTAHNKRIRFFGCKVIGLQGHGYIDGATPGGTADQINMVYTDSGAVIGCHSMYGGDMGVSFSYCTYIDVLGNTSEYNTSGGIVASNGCSVFTIAGNTAMNNGQNWNNHAPTDAARFGIGTGLASDVAIGTNVVGDDQVDGSGNPAPTQSYGVRAMYGGDNISIGVNTYKGNKVAKFYTDGLPTNINNVDAGGASADVFGKRAAYAAVTAAAAVAIATVNTWTAFPTSGSGAAPSIMLPNDGGIYRVDLSGTDATVSAAALLSLGLSGDGGATFIKQSTHNHTTTSAADRVHMSAGNVVGSGQTITVWAYASVAVTATLVASGSSPLELWATRVG